ncbi:hypothetical protein [Sphingomonas sp. S2-65]|uniref:hypothetical protein n=1 Tax=Sphingomonas sp. S2-65 TaxID=2903960 RepID=UPI001F413F60|nr:hypothetical protein [Sphingomonas sp. S2-65]UYY59745.1 hypothetical protein LZ586_06575 [Sphingomonas sp. S2-65]
MAKRVTADGPVDGPWTLPKEWYWERLGSFVSKGGTSVTPGRTPDEKFQLYSVPSHPTGHPESIVGREIGSAKQAVAANDILLCKINPRINRVWKVIDHDTGRLIASTEWIRFAPDERVEPDYLRYFLMRDAVRNYLAANASGVGGSLTRVRPSVVEPIPFPLTSRDQQRRVVTRIDELFAEIDDGEAALARARDDLATWRKALLKAAVTGELTADWRTANASTETGADLSDRILAERARLASKRLGKRRDKAPEEITPAQQRLLWPAPDGWTWMQLGAFSFVTKLAGFEYTKFVRYDDDGDLRVIKAENAGPHGFKETNYSRVRSSSVAELTRSRLHGGELLMVFVGAGTGNVATVPEGEDFFLGPNIGMMRVETDTVSPRFVELFLRSPVGKALATAAMKAVAQPSLSMGTIRQIPVLLPPAAEQGEILRRVEQALTAAADCGTDVRNQQSAAATLRQSILAAAFRGELA